MNRASLCTWSIEAVQKRNLFCALSVWNRFDILYMMCICDGIRSQLFQCIHINSIPFLRSNSVSLSCNLRKPLITAGLQKSSCHGYRPDSAAYDPIDVVIISTTGIGNSQLSCKFFRKLGCKRNGQRE